MMREKGTKILSIIMSLLMILSVISLPTLKADAAGGVDGFVERCYTVTLGRGSDAAGFADWKDQLLNGKSVGINIAYGFLFSAEYKNKNKSNEDYVKDLYKLFMDRDPDQAGFNDWVGKLNQGQSREEVFAGFANSQEFYNICESYGITAGSFVVGYDRKQVNNVNLFVERLYQTCLGRRGDRGGQKDWVNKLVKKEITGIECARSFIQSKEYINKNLSDDEYVENLYKALMGRASDAEGKSNWLYALANGMTRDEVFAGFANSKEFDAICQRYGIVRGNYTAKDKGTYDPNKQTDKNNNNQNNNSNNNQNNNNTNNQNNNTNNNNNQTNNNNNNNNNNQTNNNNNNNNQTNNNNNNNQNTTPAHTHSFTQKSTDSKYLKSAATCTKPAVYYYSCSGCGEIDKSQTFESGNALGHDWDNGTVTRSATTTDPGEKVYKCKRCEETRKELAIKAGDYFVFGKYEQDAFESNGKENITWRVLAVEGNRIYVVSEYALDSVHFDDSSDSNNYTWEKCTLRSWLNNDFYNTAFTADEKKKIPLVTLNNQETVWGDDLDSGNDTQDKVFLLDMNDVLTYFGEWQYCTDKKNNRNGYNQNLLCEPTQYAYNSCPNISWSIYQYTEQSYNDYFYRTDVPSLQEINIKVNSVFSRDVIGKRYCAWWIRSLSSNGTLGYVDASTTIWGGGAKMDMFVRPAMYIEFE